MIAILGVGPGGEEGANGGGVVALGGELQRGVAVVVLGRIGRLAGGEQGQHARRIAGAGGAQQFVELGPGGAGEREQQRQNQDGAWHGSPPLCRM